MSRWLTSDTHFGHSNILKYCSSTRPFGDLDEMHAGLIARWNERVEAEDEVIVVLNKYMLMMMLMLMLNLMLMLMLMIVLRWRVKLLSKRKRLLLPLLT